MRIFVEKLKFTGYHGVYEEERTDGRQFEVDLSVDLAHTRSASSDILDDTVDYRDLASIILEFGQGPSCILVERLAGDILDALFERLPAITSAQITIRKWATGVPGNPEHVGISLTRSRIP